MGQNYSAANLLVCVAGVNAQADMSFNGLIELRPCGRENGLEALFGIIQLLLIENSKLFVILSSVLHNKYLA